MGILTRKKDAAARAQELKSKYNIRYNDDGSSYQLVDKDTGEAAHVELGGLGVMEAGRVFPGQKRYKRLIGREVQRTLSEKVAQKQSTVTPDSDTESNQIIEGLRSRISALEAKNNTNTTSTGSGKSDNKPDVTTSSKNDNNSDKESPEVLAWREKMRNQALAPKQTKSQSLPGAISSDEVYISPDTRGPVTKFMFGPKTPSEEEVQAAKQQGKHYISTDYGVYSVSELLQNKGIANLYRADVTRPSTTETSQEVVDLSPSEVSRALANKSRYVRYNGVVYDLLTKDSQGNYVGYPNTFTNGNKGLIYFLPQITEPAAPKLVARTAPEKEVSSNKTSEEKGSQRDFWAPGGNTKTK